MKTKDMVICSALIVLLILGGSNYSSIQENSAFIALNESAIQTNRIAIHGNTACIGGNIKCIQGNANQLTTISAILKIISADSPKTEGWFSRLF